MTGAPDPGCVKCLRGISAPGILSSVVMRRQENAKICLPLAITTKSVFIFVQPRPTSDIWRRSELQASELQLFGDDMKCRQR
jgi:hypothetical protein